MLYSSPFDLFAKSPKSENPSIESKVFLLLCNLFLYDIIFWEIVSTCITFFFLWFLVVYAPPRSSSIISFSSFESYYKFVISGFMQDRFTSLKVLFLVWVLIDRWVCAPCWCALSSSILWLLSPLHIDNSPTSPFNF